MLRTRFKPKISACLSYHDDCAKSWRLFGRAACWHWLQSDLEVSAFCERNDCRLVGARNVCCCVHLWSLSLGLAIRGNTDGTEEALASPLVQTTGMFLAMMFAYPLYLFNTYCSQRKIWEGGYEEVAEEPRKPVDVWVYFIMAAPAGMSTNISSYPIRINTLMTSRFLSLPNQQQQSSTWWPRPFACLDSSTSACLCTKCSGVALRLPSPHS